MASLPPFIANFATCDLAIAAQTARFATPGVHMTARHNAVVALSRNVAPQHAMEMPLTGDMPADDAPYRPVNRVVAPGAEREEAVKPYAKSRPSRCRRSRWASRRSVVNSI
jgi:enoyl-CoA hydratase/carnithine racemase